MIFVLGNCLILLPLKWNLDTKTYVLKGNQNPESKVKFSWGKKNLLNLWQKWLYGKAYKCFILLVWLFIWFLKKRSFLSKSKSMKFSKHKSLIETIELGKRHNDMFESWAEERSEDRKENNEVSHQCESWRGNGHSYSPRLCSSWDDNKNLR